LRVPGLAAHHHWVERVDGQPIQPQPVNIRIGALAPPPATPAPPCGSGRRAGSAVAAQSARYTLGCAMSSSPEADQEKSLLLWPGGILVVPPVLLHAFTLAHACKILCIHQALSQGSATASCAGAPASLGALLAPAPVPARPGLSAAAFRGPWPLQERPLAVRRVERAVAEGRVAMRAPPRAQAGAVPPQAGLHCAVSLAQQRPLADLGLSNCKPQPGLGTPRQHEPWPYSDWPGCMPRMS